MEALTKEVEELINLIDKKEKMAALLAPSFVIDFEYPKVIGMLKRMGFKHVVEVARGAEETNKQLLSLLELHPGRRYITGPCPSIVRLIKNKYPHLEQFLAPVDSPMITSAKISAKKYPDCKKVYIGPCFAKKQEANEDHPELGILVLTYKELQQVFEKKNILPKFRDKFARFDISARKTRLYPISGGLAQSSGVTKKFTDSEYDVISGPELCQKTLEEFAQKQELKVLDILNCEGGCIGGAGIISQDSLDARRQKVIKSWQGY